MLSKTIFPIVLALYSTLVSSSLPSRATSSIKTCVVHSSKGRADDTAAVEAAFKNCSSNAIVSFSEGVDYNIFTPVTATNLYNF